jgi:hypothetical protein
LAYLIGLEGLALMRAWGDEHDETWVRARLAELRGFLHDERLTGHWSGRPRRRGSPGTSPR